MLQEGFAWGCTRRTSGAQMLLARRALAPLASRGISTSIRMQATAAADGDTATEGVKATLFSILRGIEKPMTAAELWEEAQTKGVRSKRHMKLVLQDLRKRGWVKTKPGAVASATRDKSFRYELSEKTLESAAYKRSISEA